MKNTLETRLGIFFALAVIVGFLLLETIGSFDFMATGTRLRARFETVQELSVGDPVKLGGKIVGRVDSITLTNQQVEVAMKLTDISAVRTDSQATIRFAGLMGQNYVSISFGSPSAPAVDQNTLLDAVTLPDLGTLMARLDNVASGIENITQTFTGDQIQNLLGPLTDFVRENAPRLTVILGNFQTISSRMTEGEGSIAQMLNDDSLYTGAMSAVSNFEAAANEIQVVLQDARQVLTTVTSGEGTLGKLANDDTLYQEAVGSLATMHEILSKINQGQGTMGQIVNDESLYRNVRLSLQKLDKATESLEDQGPLSAISIIVGGLF